MFLFQQTVSQIVHPGLVGTVPHLTVDHNLDAADQRLVQLVFKTYRMFQLIRKSRLQIDHLVVIQFIGAVYLTK